MSALAASRLGWMLGKRAKIGALATLACALSLAACGGSDDGTIPVETGNALLDQLERIDAAVKDGDCDLAQEESVAFAEAVNELGDEVDPQVREGLVEAGNNLSTLSREQCEPADTGATGETGVTTTEDPAPIVEPPVEEPVPEEEPEEEPPPASDDPPGNSGNSNGNGGGGGGGGGSNSGGVGGGN